MKKFTNLDNIEKYFTSEKKCLKYLEHIRWCNTPACPHCGSLNPYKLSDHKNYKCREKKCKKTFNALTETVFENTKIPLIKWFKAAYLFTSHKKGVSSIQLGKDLGITQKSAWFMLGRLRELLKDKSKIPLHGIIEADETFIGGKEKNKHQSKGAKEWRKKHDKLPKGRTTGNDNNSVVLGLLQRDGKVVNRVITDATAEYLLPIIDKGIKKGEAIITDDLGTYRNLPAMGYIHQAVKHSKKEYVVGEAHTGTIDGYWSLLKRGIYGIYHQVSLKHLPRYCDEFTFRYNTRQSQEAQRFDTALRQCENSRLKYAELIKKTEPN